MKIKNQWMRKGICLMLALVLALGCFFTDAGWQIAKAAGEYQQEDEVLFESSYDGVTHYDNCPDGQVVNNTDWYRPLAGQLFTQKVGDNGYLQYTQSSDTLGVIRLGHTYEQKSMTYTPITVTAGKTYVIEFDMRVNAAQWVVKSNATSTAKWPAQDLLMGVAVGPATTSLNTSYANYKNTYTAALQVFETLDANSKVVSTAWEGNENGWVHRKWVYTVPEDCDLSANNALQIFFADGQRCAVSIDNVKVTIPAGITVTYDIEGTKTEVFYADGNIPTDLPEGIAKDTSDGKVLRLYEDAEYTTAFSAASYERTGRYTTKTIYGRYEDFRYDEDTVLFESDYEDALATDSTVAFKAVSNQLYPKKEGENTYLYYAQSDATIGILRLGHSYKNKSLTEYTPVTVVPGQTYLIEFDYRLKTYLNEEQQQQFPWPASNMTLGVAVGDARADVTELNHVTYFNYTSYHEDEVIAVKESKPDVDWTHKTISVTIPKDCDTSKYNALQLYATLGQRCGLHIDNVKVTATAGVTVNYKVGDQTVSAYYSDGKIPSTLPEGLDATDASGNTLALYSDDSYTQKFVAEDYVRTGVYTTVTLYGRYEKFAYEGDTELANMDYSDALIPTESIQHINSGDLQPVKDPKDEANTVLRYKQRSYGLGVVQIGYDYKDIRGKENLTDYVKVYNGITYKITFDYMASGNVKNNPCEVGVAIGAPNYQYGWPTGVSQTNYLTENVTWYQELMRYPIDKSVDTGWQHMTLFVTVPEECDLSTYNALQLYAKGGSTNISVYFDNVKVIGLADRNYTVKFQTNGGNAIADKTVNLAGLNNLPQATRSNAAFMGWYLDQALTIPFELEKCIETTVPITLYAKWHIFTNGAVNTMDDMSYWTEKNGTLSSGRLNFPFVPVTENGNNVIRYTLGYASSREEQVEERGNVKQISDVYPQRMTLYNPDLTKTGEFDFMDVTYRAKVGKTYKISFSYKVTDVNTAHSEKGIGFSVLTGNIRNSHAEYVIQSNRFLIENSTTDWKTATAYFTVEKLGNDITDKGVTYYSDAIMLGVAGYGSVLIDNVSVTDWDIEAATYIEFATKGGEKIPSQEYVIGAGTTLPKAVRKGYAFDAWYLDVKCTKKFNPATYQRTNGMLVLYAGYQGMQGVTEIDFEDYSYYLSPSGELSGERISESLTPYEENGNTAVKYSLKYSTEKIEKFGNCQGEFGMYGACIGLHDPSVFEAKNAKYEDAALSVKQGESYWMKFDYKVLSVDTKSTFPSAVSFYIGTCAENSVHKDRQIFLRDLNLVDTPTDGWKTFSTYVKIPELKTESNRLSIFIVGYGELLIDNIKIMQLNNAVVFDTDGADVIEPLRGNVGQTVTLPKEPTRENSKFVGWCTDDKCTQEYTGGKMEQGVKVLYAKFLTYQTIQDFEHYSVGLSEQFESDYYLNKQTLDTKMVSDKKWLGSAYEAENVRNGEVSAKRLGDNQYGRIAGLFYMNDPMTVGEEYELSIWVKITDYFLAGDIQIAFSDLPTHFRVDDTWDKQQRGPRFETIISTEDMKEYNGQWLELKYTFTAKAKYMGIVTPGITQMYIDDACITLTSADDSYIRTIDGEGLKWEEWYKEPVKEVEEEKVVDAPKTPEKAGLPVWAIVLISVAGVAVLAGGAIALVLYRKKKGIPLNKKEVEVKNED